LRVLRPKTARRSSTSAEKRPEGTEA
jgi:hypothetical protein